MISTLVSLVLAQPSPQPADGDMISWGLNAIKWIVEQFASKNYVAAVAGIVMILTFATKLVLKDKLSSGALPLVSAAIGLVVSVITSLMTATADTTAMSVIGMIFTGVTTGATASGFWSLAGKHIVDFVKSKFGKKEEPAAEEPKES